MPSKKPWDRSSEGRARATAERRRVLIVCEDEKSACFYFRAFRMNPERTELVAVGTGMNTDSLVEHAVTLQQKAEIRRAPYVHIWCVFDRDDFPIVKYRRAFDRARQNGIKGAWANEAFELWYLLHFNYHDSAISRHNYPAKLSPHFSYDKADATVYERLKPRQMNALRNAKTLDRKSVV